VKNTRQKILGIFVCILVMAGGFVNVLSKDTYDDRGGIVAESTYDDRGGIVAESTYDDRGGIVAESNLYNGDPHLDYAIMCDWVKGYDNHGPPKTQFYPHKDVYSYNEISNVKKGDVFHTVWKKDGEIVHVSSGTNPVEWEGKGCMWSWWTPSMAGSWRVDVYGNDKYLGSGPTFTIIQGEPELTYSIMCDWVNGCGDHGPSKTEFNLGDKIYSYSEMQNGGKGDKIVWKWEKDGKVYFTDETNIGDSWINFCAWDSKSLDSPGQWKVRLYYNDQYLGSGPTFTVKEQNRPPTKLNGPNGERNTIKGKIYEYTASASDPDGDELYYRWGYSEHPQYAPRLTYTEWEGPYESNEICTFRHTWDEETDSYRKYNYIAVIVKDSHDAEKSSCAIVINTYNPINNAPFIHDFSGPSEANEGDFKFFNIWAKDVDGDRIRFIIDWGDGTVTRSKYFDTNGNFINRQFCHNWHVPSGVGNTCTFTITVKAEDTKGAVSTDWRIKKHEITINANKPELMSAVYPDRIYPLQTFNIKLKAFDPQGDDVRFHLDWEDPCQTCSGYNPYEDCYYPPYTSDYVPSGKWVSVKLCTPLTPTVGFAYMGDTYSITIQIEDSTHSKSIYYEIKYKIGVGLDAFGYSPVLGPLTGPPLTAHNNDINMTVTVDDEGDGDFRTIQDAIDSAGSGSIIKVYSGLYQEHLYIVGTHNITLLGINSELGNGDDFGPPVIENRESDNNTIDVYADGVTVSGFIISNYAEDCNGIYLHRFANNNIIRNNTITRCQRYGIRLHHCQNNTISENRILNCSHECIYMSISDFNIITNNYLQKLNFLNGTTAIRMDYCENNTINGNNIISVYNGLYLDTSKNNALCGNSVFTMIEYSAEINIFNSTSNLISGNTIKGFGNNNTGIYLRENSSENIIYRNNFINNSPHVLNGLHNLFFYENEGNYWDDYIGDDNDGDGIGDVPYEFEDGVADEYPLMNIWQNTEPKNLSLFAMEEKGEIARQCNFSILADDVNNDQLYYMMDWGNNRISTWLGPYNANEVIKLSCIWWDGGVYAIKAKTMDAYGSISNWSESLHINITFPPIALINGPYAGGVGDLIHFDASSSYDPDGNIVKFVWDMETGTTITEKSFDYTYNNSGLYWVTLLVEDDDGNIDHYISTATIANDNLPMIELIQPCCERMVSGKFEIKWAAFDLIDGANLHIYISYSDDNGMNWKSLSDSPIVNDGSYELDTHMFSDGHYMFRVTAEDSNGNSAYDTSPQIFINNQVDNNPPSLHFISPLNGIYLNDKMVMPFFSTIIFGPTTISLDVIDNESGINKVELYVDDNLWETDHIEPFTWILNERLFGRHKLKAIAFDNYGNQKTTEKIVWKFF